MSQQEVQQTFNNTGFVSFNFKLVYTDIVKKITIETHKTLQDLFDMANEAFAPYINYKKYTNIFVVCGQDKCELASGIGYYCLDFKIDYAFECDDLSLISFYVRPTSLIDNEYVFIRKDNYIDTENETEQSDGNMNNANAELENII